MISPPHDLFDYEQLFIHVCHVVAESLTPSMVDHDYSICNEYLHILNIHGRSSMELWFQQQHDKRVLEYNNIQL